MNPRTIGLAVALALGCASFAAAETRNIDRTLPLGAGGTVAVEAHNGWIEIHTWDRPQVEVHARIDLKGVPVSSSRFPTVDVDGTADRVSIRWNAGDFYNWTFWSLFDGSWTGPVVHYTITAPRTARLDIRTHNANTDIRDVNAAVRVTTHNGSVRLANQAGPIDLNMHNGWARADFASFTADSRVTMHNGTAELVLPAASRFNFSARGHHMNVASDFPVATRTFFDGGSRRRDGSVNGGGPELRVVSHNGSVSVRSK